MSSFLDMIPQIPPMPPSLAEMGPYLLTAWTESCSLPPSGSETWGSFLVNCIHFLLFGLCPQRVVMSTIHLVFLGIVILIAISKVIRLRRAKPSALNGNGALLNGRGAAHGVHCSTLFIVTFAVILFGALVHTSVTVWRIGFGVYYGWGDLPAEELVYSLSQALAWLTFLTIVAHQKKYGSTQQPYVLRAWWIATCLFTLLNLWSAVGRFLDRDPRNLQLWVDDSVTLVTAPLVFYLFVVATVGVTGITMVDSDITQPLLFQSEADGQGRIAAPEVTKFASANLFSVLIWLWLNPLLAKGISKALGPSDVPLLAPSDNAEPVYVKFKSSYEAQTGVKSARRAIVSTYWPQLLFTALLALIKLSVMYVGPLLITPISENVNGQELFPYEGYVLVGILLLAKIAEVLSSHHYNFFSNKLGMVVRSSLITAVYQKGLKLTSHARQTHGAGQITNYMTVDVQMIADCVVQLHNLWILPLQIIGAAIILYGVVGLSCLGGIATIVLTVAVGFLLTSLMRKFQGMVMRSKDSRMAVTTEVLNSMKIIKLQAWEDKFKERIEATRVTERSWLKKFVYTLSVNIYILWQSPIIVATATFALCVLVREELTPSKVFTAMSTFRIMQEPLRLFPTALMNISQALNSFDRLTKYFLSEELDMAAVERHPVGSKFSVEVEGGVFKWESEEESPTLKNINFKVERGSLVAIVGMVGSGKSSLLSAVLGEVPKLSGKVRVSGTTAYVAQGAWIQNATIKDNILFGKPFDEAKYHQTLKACALVEDLAQMDFGDQTEIGERGINLSGGQKQRIQLARAVYQDADTYLLDDIFSAVDAHTGAELFDKCIKGALRSKTILLVTHQVEFLNGADLILVMRDGHIVQAGKYNDLLEAGTDLNALVAAHNEAMDKVESTDNLAEMEKSGKSPFGKSPSSKKTLEKGSSMHSSGEKEDFVAKKGKAKLVEDERRESGQVSWRLYWLYATKAYGGVPFLFLILASTLFQVIQIAGDYYLSDATSEKNADSFKPGHFILRYSEYGFGSGVAILFRTVLLAFVGLRTAQAFFLSMLSRIFRAPMSFFDTTPTGRILTRFSNDQSNIDFLIPIVLGVVLGQVSQALGILFVVCQVTWQLILLVVPLAYVFVSYRNYYIATSRELTRLDSVSKAPIVHHFSETISGFVTIRAFQKQNQFCEDNFNKVNGNLRMDFHNNAANEWLGFRLEMIGTVVLCVSALLMIAFRGHLNSDLVGLSLSYGLALNTCLYGVVFMSCQAENKMVSIERVDQYCHIDSEAPPIIPDHRPPPAWPVSGNLHFQRLELRYRPETPLVLKGITLYIRDGEKVGVVGRTGSGKSTLIQALFRLVEPAGGSIIVDGLDITTIGLKDLRSQFAIIPQEPTLFKGTVRYNLDPLGEYPDSQIWEALAKCQLANTVKEKEGKLDADVQENGENWSVGQRQLFCLGRALLKHSKILVLDEATASVDAQTDVIIQNTIQSEFRNSTVISIAHRIPTVMDSDKVLVLDAGHVKEFDSPSRLLEQHSSLFAALVREYTTRSGNAEA
ncbi:unnamed protein product [Calypogeia fissa]